MIFEFAGRVPVLQPASHQPPTTNHPFRETASHPPMTLILSGNR
jgi:hypothetical protein